MIAFDPVGHTYVVDGDPDYVSVTTILAVMGLTAFDHLPPSIREGALARGRAVHAAVHYYNENDLDVDQFAADFPTEAGYLAGWVNFRAERAFVPVLNEYRIASPRYRVVGTLDCLGLLDGRPVLVDFKTGSPADAAADLQLAAYHGIALEWATHDPTLAAFFAAYPAVKRLAVQLRRDGSFRVETYDDPGLYREFLALATAHRIIARRRRDVGSNAA